MEHCAAGNRTGEYSAQHYEDTSQAQYKAKETRHRGAHSVWVHLDLVQKQMKETRDRALSRAGEEHECWRECSGGCSYSFKKAFPRSPVYTEFVLDWIHQWTKVLLFLPADLSLCECFTGITGAILPSGKETSRFELPFKTEKRVCPHSWLDILPIFFCWVKKIDLKWLFNACFKRELDFARGGQLFILLQGIICVAHLQFWMLKALQLRVERWGYSGPS